MHKTIIEIEHIKGGQPRPYADHEYEAYVTARIEGMLLNNTVYYLELKDEDVRALARRLLSDFKDKPAWHEPKLEYCAPVEPSKEMLAIANNKNWKPKAKSRWHVKIVQPYLD